MNNDIYNLRLNFWSFLVVLLLLIIVSVFFTGIIIFVLPLYILFLVLAATNHYVREVIKDYKNSKY